MSARPNLVLIMADQMRADACGCYGNDRAGTPAVDALAARGALMREHMTPNQICAPSRATIFSGLYARHNGVVRNGIALSERTELLSHALVRAGYSTHGVGKFHFQPILAGPELGMPDSNAFWTLPRSRDWHGPFYGFRTADILIGESVAATEGGHYARWLRESSPDAIPLYRREHALAPPPPDFDEVWKCAVPEALHYNSWIADRARDFIRRQADGGPFFLFVSFPDPHHPFAPPEPWCDRFDPRDMPAPEVVADELRLMPGYIEAQTDFERRNGAGTYLDFLIAPGAPREQGFMTGTASMNPATLRLAIAHTYGAVSMIDACIGRIIAALAEAGVVDDTLVVFTSDHGELLGDHGLLRKGPPPYWQLLNVPLVIAGPGVAPLAVETLTSHIDLKATLLELLDVPGDAGDGVSFAAALRGTDASARTSAFGEYHPRVEPDQYNQTLVTADWRLTVYPHRSDWGELFDRRSDRGEHRNRFDDPACAGVRDRLTRQIQREWPPAPAAGGKQVAVY